MPQKRKSKLSKRTKDAKRMKNKRSNESNKQREKRLNENRERTEQWENNRTKEQIEEKNALLRKRYKRMVKNESSTERKLRLDSNSIKKSTSRKNLWIDLKLEAFKYNSQNDYRLIILII